MKQPDQAKFITVSFWAALVLIVFIGLESYRNILEITETNQWVSHTLEVLREIDELYANLSDIESGARGYALWKNPVYLEPYRTAIQKMDMILAELRTLTQDNPRQQHRLDQLQPLIAQKIAWHQAEVKAVDAGKFQMLMKQASPHSGFVLMTQIQPILTEMLADENQLLTLRQEKSKRAAHQRLWILGIGNLCSLSLLLIGFYALRHQIAELRKAEGHIQDLNEVLRTHNTRLLVTNKELEAFSYSVSHDLRTPLRAIDGFSRELLENVSDRLDDQGKSDLHRIRAAAQRMAQLIDDLLKLSRVTRTEMTRERVDLSGTAEVILQELQKTQPERKIQYAIAPHLTTLGDPQLLRLVLENLLGNAWKFTEKKPQARIEFGLTEHEGKKAYFVRDNGAGFNMEYAGKLFGAFQRFHETQEFPGTGVGLATVQRIIHRHGGQIWADAAVNQGATFYFTFS